MRSHLIAWGLACIALPGLAADTYLLDGIHSVPVFEFTHLGLSTQSGRFDRVQGRIVLDRAGKSGSVALTIDASSLNMGHGTATPESPGFELLKVREFSSIQFESNHLFFVSAPLTPDSQGSGIGDISGRRRFQGRRASTSSTVFAAGNSRSTRRSQAYGSTPFALAVSTKE